MTFSWAAIKEKKTATFVSVSLLTGSQVNFTASLLFRLSIIEELLFDK